ncbi:hypothetical protein L902_06815 [Agrobacterium radiobacter DSM 30147]|nr:hypothetical protein L902_06815 [Agrobacterium radiobacter DSM 30147]
MPMGTCLRFGNAKVRACLQAVESRKEARRTLLAAARFRAR